MPECAAVGEAAETVHQEEEVPVDDHLRGVRLLHLLPAAGGRHALHHLGVPGDQVTPHTWVTQIFLSFGSNNFYILESWEMTNICRQASKKGNNLG